MAKSYPKPYLTVLDGLALPGHFPEKHLREALDYEYKPGQIVLSTFPKCGTTWTQTILLLIMRKGEPIEGGFSDIFRESPFLEMMGAKKADDMKRPGVLKIHLPLTHVKYNPEIKYIYVIRNPRDACVSFYYHSKERQAPLRNASFDEFFEVFINGENDYGDYFDHLLSWWKHRHDQNVMFISYEEIKNDHRGAVKRFAKFLGPEYEELVEDDQVLDNIVKYSSIDYMKQTVNSNLTAMFSMKKEDMPDWYRECREHKEKLIAEGKIEDIKENPKREFIRKGIVGDWKNHFNEDQVRRLQERFFEKTKDHDVSELVEIWKKNDCF